MSSTHARTTDIRFATALSGHLDPLSAAEHVATRCAEGLAGAKPDFAALMFSGHHTHASMGVVNAVLAKLAPGTLIGCSAEAVLGGEVEMEGVPGMALLAASMPGVRLHTFTTGGLPMVREDAPEDLDALAASAGFGPDHRGSIILADPFSTASGALLPALTRARIKHANPRSPDRRPSPIIGGFASAATRPGGNAIILNDRLFNAGGVGVSFSGAVRIDALVSQGCKPIGPPMIVTSGKGQMLGQLGGRPALRVLTEILDGLDMSERQKLRRGLFLGRAITEYKDRFGRDDFLIRNVIGVEKTQEAVAVADLIKVGQTVQFFIRDAQTADQDLALLLDAQKLHETPAGVLLFTCNGRGSRLFDAPHHDAAAFARAFAPDPDASMLAKAGTPMPVRSPVPLAGFFCAGEIGPVGDEVFVHGQTVAAALFRSADLPA